MSSLLVAELAKSFGVLQIAESLGNFRYGSTRKLNVVTPLVQSLLFYQRFGILNKTGSALPRD